ncbi:membrane protein [Marinobacterium zhoushanense]|uniref:Membrane protein n=1 Tax=Marinobacterium zhoushanense TaxID=1679163 RepID=A0ABQ1KBI8_9GAMM|nr:SLC13 family permease [Marinobacterium zhoushanense]GGB94732.1 membrane protein [Marinobacterium zhoushanense]
MDSIMPALPDGHGIAILLLIVVALFMFTREEIPLETSSLLVLVVLAVGFALFPYRYNGELVDPIDLFHGFGHEALIAVCALMIAGQGLVRTGALEPIGRLLARFWAVSPMFSLLLTLLIGAFLSAFVNNVPIVVLLLPILVSVALRTGKPASGMLMPMGFATLVGGMGTTIGTSTNLLVIAVAADLGMRHFQMFDFFLPAAIAASVAILYLWLVAPRILPVRVASLDDSSPRLFTAQLHIEEDGFSDGRTLSELQDKVGSNMNISAIRRGETLIVPLPDAMLRAGDRLRICDTPENLTEFSSTLDAALFAGEVRVDDENPLRADDQQIAEIVVTQGSLLEGSTLAHARLAERYHMLILALHRPGTTLQTLSADLGDLRLRIGDVLLVQGSQEQIASLKQSVELLVLDATSDLPHTQLAPLALTIMASIVVVAALGLMPIAISAVAGVLLMILTRCLRWQDVVQALSTPVIMIVVASLALGMALLKTGGANYLAELYVALSAGASPSTMLSGLMLIMAILTNIVSNNAAAVIGTPIAFSISQQLGLPPEPYVLAVLFGANMSYATPMAYKTNLLVMSAGGYRFSDFMRVGIPLTIIVWLVLSWILPKLYGLG